MGLRPPRRPQTCPRRRASGRRCRPGWPADGLVWWEAWKADQGGLLKTAVRRRQQRHVWPPFRSAPPPPARPADLEVRQVLCGVGLLLEAGQLALHHIQRVDQAPAASEEGRVGRQRRGGRRSPSASPLDHSRHSGSGGAPPTPVHARTGPAKSSGGCERPGVRGARSRPSRAPRSRARPWDPFASWECLGDSIRCFETC